MAEQQPKPAEVRRTLKPDLPIRNCRPEGLLSEERFNALSQGLADYNRRRSAALIRRDRRGMFGE